MRWDDLKIEAIVDKINIQIFVDDGEMHLVVPYNSPDSEKVVEAFADLAFPSGGAGRGARRGGIGGQGAEGRGSPPPSGMAPPRTKDILKRFELYTLKSIWELATIQQVPSGGMGPATQCPAVSGFFPGKCLWFRA
jgi:hypothetical protein